MNIYDTQTGALLAVIQENGWLTSARTACGIGIVDGCFSILEGKTLGIIGTGKQSEFALQAIMAETPKYIEILVWNRTKYKAEKMIEKREKLYPSCIVRLCEDIRQVVKNSDTVLVATASKTPLITQDMLGQDKGITIIGIGADTIGKCEIDPLIYKTCKVFVDSTSSCEIL